MKPPEEDLRMVFPFFRAAARHMFLL